MKIGNLQLSNNLIMAPLAGITDLPFRTLVRRYGCGLCYTEMVSADGLIRGHKATINYLRTSPADRPLIIQIFGSDPAVIADAARVAQDRNWADAVDINMGCPVRSVVRRGAGAALMKDPERIRLMIRKARASVQIPLTVKIRAGWSSTERNALAVARIAEEEGADAISVHPRTAAQGFSGRADWSIIAEVKATLRIPVIGNGDVEQPADAKAMLAQTGCDGVMIGRGALGNPWIFREAHRLLDGECAKAVSLKERKLLIEEHLEMSVGHYGSTAGVQIFRKHLFWYTKGLRGGARFRKEAGTIAGKRDLLTAISTLFETLADGAVEEKKALDISENLDISFGKREALSRVEPEGTEKR
jgi:tRNA-dihydrouridine synthase B